MDNMVRQREKGKKGRNELVDGPQSRSLRTKKKGQKKHQKGRALNTGNLTLAGEGEGGHSEEVRRGARPGDGSKG